MLKEQIGKVQQGLDPLGVIRDRDHPMIDTNLTKSVTMEYPTGIATPTVETGPMLEAARR